MKAELRSDPPDGPGMRTVQQPLDSPGVGSCQQPLNGPGVESGQHPLDLQTPRDQEHQKYTFSR